MSSSDIKKSIHIAPGEDGDWHVARIVIGAGLYIDIGCQGERAGTRAQKIADDIHAALIQSAEKHQVQGG